MIIDSSKDYGTGNVLMILDGKTTTEEVIEYLRRNYSVNDCLAGSLEWTPEGNHKGFVNQATVTYIVHNTTESEE